MVRRLAFLLVFGCAVNALAVPAAGTTAGRPEVTWSLHRRGLGFFGWRPRLAAGGGGVGWIGGGAPLGSPGGLLYRWQQGEWTPWKTSPVQAARTFVLGVDPAGSLWLCAYSPTDEATYGGLRVRHYDGRRWWEEIVAPGIWPQAISMVSAEEGWIGGNNGSLLHRSAGVWRRTSLALNEAERRGRNVHALKMLSRDEGWLVGASGLVAHYSAGQWRIVPVPQAVRSENLYALDVAAGRSLWLAGSRGLLARLDAQGWHLFRATGSFHLMGLAMVSAVDGWAVGEYGTILRWDGKAWRRQLSPTLATLYDVAMVSAEEGWIVGNDVVLRSSPRRRLQLRDGELRGRYSVSRQPGLQIAAVDADGDRDLDLFSLQPTAIHLFENRGEEGFYEASGLAPPALSILAQHAWGDVDGDGDLDLLVLARSPAAAWLYRNRGGLRFAPPERLAVGPLGGNDSAAFVDLDGDGDLDLYVARSAGQHELPNLIYHNDGNGSFRLVDASTGDKGIEMFTLWGDVDGDLDVDAVLPGNGGRELSLLINRGGTLRDATAGSGLDTPLGDGQMFQGGLLDLDLDGDLDLLLLGDRLYAFRGDGKAHFRRDDALFDAVLNNPAVPSTLSNAGDLDHDGYPEILLQPVTRGGRSVRLFSRGPDGRYHDIASQAGLAGVAGNAAVFADWDGDGDLDLYVAGDEGGYLLENLRDDGGYLTLRLHGDRGNRPAFGSQVRLWDAGHLGEPRFLRGHQQLGVGFNPSGVQEVSALVFGADPRRSYDVEVLFPSGRRAVERDLRPGRVLDIYESPPGMRQVVLGWRWARRACRAADFRRELPKLALVLLALLLWRSLAAELLGARQLARRWSLSAGLLGAYLVTAGCLAVDRRPSADSLQLLGFAGVLSVLTVVDRRLTSWRSSRYLGPYRLHETLGEGGMGVVYRARHVVTGQAVALKVLHPRVTDREDHRLRFLREARILTRLEHPNIVRVFETGEIGGRGYISMELLAGESLRRRVRRDGPLAAAEVRLVLEAACGALACAHRQGVVHRDVKSDNLFLVEAAAGHGGGQPRVKLMDFGLSRASDMNTLTDRSALLGTLPYMPPEVLAGQAPDARSDLYSLGVVAFESLTGRLPFEAGDEGSLLARIQTGEPAPLRDLRPDVPEPLARLVEALLARDPRQRPASAEAVSAMLADRLPSALEEPGAATAEPAADTSVWQERFAQARSCLAAGKATEAQVRLVECVAELERVLAPLDPAARERYTREHDLPAVMELMDRLSPRPRD